MLAPRPRVSREGQFDILGQRAHGLEGVSGPGFGGGIGEDEGFVEALLALLFDERHQIDESQGIQAGFFAQGRARVRRELLMGAALFVQRRNALIESLQDLFARRAQSLIPSFRVVELERARRHPFPLVVADGESASPNSGHAGCDRGTPGSSPDFGTQARPRRLPIAPVYLSEPTSVG